MRRYLPLFLVSFFVIVIILTVSTILEGYADKKNPENIKYINIYTSLPLEQASIIAQEYEKSSQIKVNIIPIAEQELIAKLTNPTTPHADLILTTQLVLDQAKKLKLIEPYQSEQTDIIPDRFKDADDYWTGVWYDPIIFAINQDFLKAYGKDVAAWPDLIKDNKVRIGITDFVAAQASANLLYSMTAVNGEQQTISYLNKLHPQVIQYAKFLSTPIRMAGMGECDVAIAVQSETIRYIQDGFPIKIIYPQDGTAFSLTGIAVVRNSEHNTEAKAFVDWLIHDDINTVLQENRFYFIPTNPEAHWLKEYPRNVKLFEIETPISSLEQQKIMDLWIKTVRFGTK